jgi:hypothetical protein
MICFFIVVMQISKKWTWMDIEVVSSRHFGQRRFGDDICPCLRDLAAAASVAEMT